MIKQLFNGRFLGHPIHLMLIHFPIAFLLLSAVLDLISLIQRSNYFSELGFYSSVIGIAAGLFAAIFGIIDLLKIKNDPALLGKALTHGGLNVLWIMIFAVIAGIQFKDFPNFEISSFTVVLIKLFCVIGILFSNYLGGQLIFKYDILKKI